MSDELHCPQCGCPADGHHDLGGCPGCTCSLSIEGIEEALHDEVWKVNEPSEEEIDTIIEFEQEMEVNEWATAQNWGGLDEHTKTLIIGNVRNFHFRSGADRPINRFITKLAQRVGELSERAESSRAIIPVDEREASHKEETGP